MAFKIGEGRFPSKDGVHSFPPALTSIKIGEWHVIVEKINEKKGEIRVVYKDNDGQTIRHQTLTPAQWNTLAESKEMTEETPVTDHVDEDKNGAPEPAAIKKNKNRGPALILPLKSKISYDGALYTVTKYNTEKGRYALTNESGRIRWISQEKLVGSTSFVDKFIEKDFPATKPSEDDIQQRILKNKKRNNKSTFKDIEVTTKPEEERVRLWEMKKNQTEPMTSEGKKGVELYDAGIAYLSEELKNRRKGKEDATHEAFPALLKKIKNAEDALANDNNPQSLYAVLQLTLLSTLQPPKDAPQQLVDRLNKLSEKLFTKYDKLIKETHPDMLAMREKVVADLAYADLIREKMTYAFNNNDLDGVLSLQAEITEKIISLQSAEGEEYLVDLLTDIRRDLESMKSSLLHNESLSQQSQLKDIEGVANDYHVGDVFERGGKKYVLKEIHDYDDKEAVRFVFAEEGKNARITMTLKQLEGILKQSKEDTGSHIEQEEGEQPLENIYNTPFEILDGKEKDPDFEQDFEQTDTSSSSSSPKTAPDTLFEQPTPTDDLLSKIQELKRRMSKE